MIANTAPIDVTGHPAITVPAGMARVPAARRAACRPG